MKPYRRGFTLIEMLVVVAIISMLAAVVAYNMMGNLDKGKLQGTKGQILNLSLALESYKTDLGSYPPSAWLADTLEKGLGASLKWHGPYYKFETARTGFVDGSGNLLDRRNSPLQFLDGSNAESALLPNRGGRKSTSISSTGRLSTFLITSITESPPLPTSTRPTSICPRFNCFHSERMGKAGAGSCSCSTMALTTTGTAWPTWPRHYGVPSKPAGIPKTTLRISSCDRLVDP
jgi:general secretion pathway protein G